MTEQNISSDELLQTPLNALHRELGGRMVGFAGYDMPVQFNGIKSEHLHTRAAAGLFDVSHMGQVRLTGDNAIAALEKLVPGDVEALGVGRMRYTMLLTDDGGIIDDLMVTRREQDLFLVVNGACKQGDIAHMRQHLPADVVLEELTSQALVALQGPQAELALARLNPAVADMKFMNAQAIDLDGIPCFVSRSGYTGEDGYEISVLDEDAEQLCRRLLDMDEVAPIGLGARDSLRLESGLCLYGHDIDTTTSPAEAGLMWSISKRRRAEANFPGAGRILSEVADGPSRRRVGLLALGKAPIREGAEIQTKDGETVGVVTSGGFGPTVERPVAMGYVAAGHTAEDTELQAIVRGKPQPVVVRKMPFITQNYKR